MDRENITELEREIISEIEKSIDSDEGIHIVSDLMRGYYEQVQKDAQTGFYDMDLFRDITRKFREYSKKHF